MESEVETLIIGAGLSGLMMGYLHKRNYLIVEASPAINFDIGTPFYLHAPLEWLPTAWKEIDVHHHCWDGARFHRVPDLRMMNNYSRKIVGKIIDTSLKFMDGSVKRGFVPEGGNAGQVLKDLVNEVGSNLHLATKLIKLDAKNKAAAIELPHGSSRIIRYKNLVSTLPLPVMLKMLGLEFPHKFESDPITTIFFDLLPGASVEAFQTINITDPADPFYRVSLMDQKIVFETMNPDDQDAASLCAYALELGSKLWGFILDPNSGVLQTVKPGKFHPIPKTARKQLLAKLTNEFGIYCLGRYAIWDYQRIDHVAENAKKILQLMKLVMS